MTKSNQKPVGDIINTILAALKEQTKSWMVIAKELDLARSQYGEGSDQEKEIIKATGLGKPTISKLAQIGGYKRLADFESVHAWTVLYEISLMIDAEIEIFKDKLSLPKNNGIPTVTMVRNIRFPEPKEVDPYQAAFTIRIDKNALKGDMIDGDAYEKLVDLVAQIQNEVPYVRVDATDIYENEASRMMSEISRKMEVVKRQKVGEAITAYKKKTLDWQIYQKDNSVGEPLLEPWSEEELWAHFDENGAFEILKELSTAHQDLTESDVCNEARERLSKSRRKFAEQANNQFAFANTISSTSGSVEQKEAA